MARTGTTAKSAATRSQFHGAAAGASDYYDYGGRIRDGGSHSGHARMLHSNGGISGASSMSIHGRGPRRYRPPPPSLRRRRPVPQETSLGRTCVWIVQALAVGFAAVFLTHVLVWYALARQIPEATEQASIPFHTLSACMADPAHVLEFTSLPENFEPSDAVFHPFEKRLYIVSDDGKLGQFSMVGQLQRSWFVTLPPAAADIAAASYPAGALSLSPRSLARLGQNEVETDAEDGSSQGKRADLEGLALVPHRPDYLYLGNEHPSAILEFSLKQGKVTRVFPLGGVIGIKKKHGIEALTYVPDPMRPTSGLFYVGRQKDAQIFVFDIPPPLAEDHGVAGTLRAENLTYRGTFTPPGPGKDLSALYYTPEQLFAVYDKPKEVVNIDLLDKRIALVPDKFISADLSDVKPARVNMELRGIEAFTIARLPTGEMYVYLGIDQNHKARRLLRYTC